MWRGTIWQNLQDARTAFFLSALPLGPWNSCVEILDTEFSHSYQKWNPKCLHWCWLERTFEWFNIEKICGTLDALALKHPTCYVFSQCYLAQLLFSNLLTLLLYCLAGDKHKISRNFFLESTEPVFSAAWYVKNKKKALGSVRVVWKSVTWANCLTSPTSDWSSVKWGSHTYPAWLLLTINVA